jgi:hypothetical protein
MKVRTIMTLATVAIVVAGCAKATTNPGSGSPSSGAISHATGAGDLVIQVGSEGGFIAPSFSLKQIPQFSLFGDGSILTPGVEPAIYPGSALPSIEQQMVTEAGIQAILRSAIAAGLENAKDYTDFVGVADMSTTVLTFQADGISHTVKVYALGAPSERPAGMSTEEFQARKALAQFVDDLGTLQKWLPAGSLGSTQPFDGSGARLFVSAYQPDAQLTEPAKAWPLDPPLGSFGTPSTDMGTRCGVVTGQDWTATLLPLAKDANSLTPWTSAGQRYAISFRPLLPNETSC